MEITAHEVINKYWWYVSLNNFEFGDGLMSIKPKVHGVVIDTGTSMIMGYYDDIDNMQRAQCDFINQNLDFANCYNQLPGELYVENCTDELLDKMPNLKF